MIEVIIALAVLGLALLIRSFAGGAMELHKPFFIVVGIFLVLYIGATILISSRIGNAWGAPQNQISSSSNTGYSSEQPINQIDYTTGP
ncbi:MAG: hypothetical protein WCW31_01630 [Patescibacteria group bacterium]|jgi:hypothetical protein